jgi:hypothetical protein
MNKNEFIDYSTLLMDIERKTKDLHDKCLHKKYEGYMADIVSIHSDLTLLATWIQTQQTLETIERYKK